MHVATVGWIKLLVFQLILSSGQVLFKLVANATRADSGERWLLALAKHPLMWIAVSLYAAATLLWVNILQTLPLSRAYPVMALAFLLVPLAGVVFFGERLDARYLLGVVLIMGGVILVSRG
jgi:drug/metabolite transporter (DMT)-like permease